MSDVRIMKTTLTETHTATTPERRIWIVLYQGISFTFKRKAPAKQLKAILDTDTPTTTIRQAGL